MPERTFLEQVSDWRGFAFLAATISAVSGTLIYYRNMITKNYKAAGENAGDIKRLKEVELPNFVKKDQCRTNHDEILRAIKNISIQVNQARIEDQIEMLEDHLQFIEVREGEGTATNMDKAMAKQYLRRLENLRK